MINYYTGDPYPDRLPTDTELRNILNILDTYVSNGVLQIHLLAGNILLFKTSLSVDVSWTNENNKNTGLHVGITSMILNQETGQLDLYDDDEHRGELTIKGLESLNINKNIHFTNETNGSHLYDEIL